MLNNEWSAERLLWERFTRSVTAEMKSRSSGTAELRDPSPTLLRLGADWREKYMARRAVQHRP